MNDQFANISFDDETVGPEPGRIPEEALALDDIFASPSAVPEPEPKPVSAASADDQIGRLQIAIGDRDARLRAANDMLFKLESELNAARGEAAAAAEANKIASKSSVKFLLEVEARGDAFIVVPCALKNSIRELRKVVADAAKIYASSSHQPLLQITVRDISTMKPTPAAELPPKRRRKIFGLL
jgi:hypothetical protein